MQVAGLIFRLGLAAVFMVAAAGKVLDPRGSRDAARAFGVPSALAPVVAVVLPFVEVAIAIALVPASLALIGGVAALALLATFERAQRCCAPPGPPPGLSLFRTAAQRAARCGHVRAQRPADGGSGRRRDRRRR